jgi:glycosyltransferase involved in cell wall biosynthesis/GT2 family glycosyltransferase
MTSQTPSGDAEPAQQPQRGLSVTVIVPVKDGERYLQELLDAVRDERPEEIIVVDSGSRDGSLEIARAAGVRLLEIDAREFAHGRTRNYAAEQSSGELICFLTQDATPCPGWLDAYVETFSLDAHVGAAYGPHLPRADTSPMIARELTEFFAGFSPDGLPAVQHAGDSSFLSNVNACYARACWEQIRFRDVAYSEDQAFGADMLDAGWAKVYQPRAAVLHAHDYSPVEFMRRYFDEYRGLRESVGHVEPFGLRSTIAGVRTSLTADRRWMQAQRMAPSEQAAWTARAALHHGGRRVFSALGSRSDRVPAPLQRALSLERRDANTNGNGAGAPGVPALPPAEHIDKMLAREDYDVVGEVWRDGARPLIAPQPGMSERERLRLALVIPPFTRGSGGHNTLFQIFSRLEQRGHACSVWLADYQGHMRDVWPAVLRHDINEFFARFQGPVYKGFDAWQGADVAIATGWQTVHAILGLEQCRARAYVVNDHEPEFYATSTERVLAEDTYRHGLHCIAASPWLRDLLRERYDADADAFQLGVDGSTYRPLELERRTDTVVYYARHSTPRRAVPIGMLALAELHRRMPDARIVLFGTDKPLHAAFPYEHLGVLSTPQLARLYSESTVGLCLSLTNFSLMPKEMLACGLPCVELEGVSAESIFGQDGPLELAPLDPVAIARALERLLRERDRWRERSQAGIEFVASHTWEHATDEVEAGLRHALYEREATLSRSSQ